MAPIEMAVWGIRALSTVAGLLLLYAAFFLYPAERNRVQSKLEEWWIRLDDARARADRDRPVLVQSLARTVRGGFDRLFGEPLSTRFFVVSGLLSMASFSLSLTRIGDYGWAVPSGLLVFSVATGIAAMHVGRSVDQTNEEIRRLADERMLRYSALLDPPAPLPPPGPSPPPGSMRAYAESERYLDLLAGRSARPAAYPVVEGKAWWEEAVAD